MKENQFNGVSQVNFNNDLEKLLNLDDSSKLTRQFIKEENEWKKTKAILEQKIDLLKMEIEDSKKREENLQKMNETILSSLNDVANDSNKVSTSKVLFKDLLERIDEYNKDFLDKKEKTWEIVSKYEKENKQLKDNINELQLKVKENEFNHEKSRLGLEHKIQELDLINKQLKSSQKSSEDDKKKLKEIHEKEFQNKNEDFSREVELIKQNHQYEIERMRQKSSKELNDLKELYEKEKTLWDYKLDRLEKDLREYRRVFEENPPTTKQDGLYTEEHLHILINEITEKNELKIKELETINYELTKKVQNLDKDSRDRNSPLELQEVLNLRKENSQQNKTIIELRKKGENLEDSVKALKNLLYERDSLLEDYNRQHKSQPVSLSNQEKKDHEEDQMNFISNDNRRFFKYSSINSYPKEKNSQEPPAIYKTPIKQYEDSENMQMDPASYSRSYQNQSHQIHPEEQNKRSPIKMFNKEIKKSPYVLENRGSNTNNVNVMDLMKSTTSIQYKVQENIEGYSEYEENDKIIEKGNKTEISRKCYSNLENKASIPVPYEDFVNNRQKKVMKENNQEKINEDILNILMQLNKEKSIIEEKLAELERRLSESENSNENLQYEKEKLKKELTKIYQDVRIAKSGLPNFEENSVSNNKSQNNEKDATLKTEIKFLINKLLKAKGKLVKEKTDHSFKESSANKSRNYYSNMSSYEHNNRNSDQKKQLQNANVSFENNERLRVNRSRTPILYKESRKDFSYVKENVN